jgi:hypothetical protein
VRGPEKGARTSRRSWTRPPFEPGSTARREFGQPHEPPREPEALTEVGFTIPAGGVTYWVGEAMGEKEYKDLAKPPKAFAKWTPMLASNAAHLARLLKAENYPGIEGGR